MGLADAQTARAMAQKIQRALPGIQYRFINTTPLLKIAQQKGKIRYRGSHTEEEWFIYKDGADPATWGGGELTVNTFEEQDPATRAKLPFCYLQKNYGVSDRTMETNRHSPDKVYKPLAANLKLAEVKMYDAIRDNIYSGSTDGNGDGSGAPVGLKWAFGDAYENSTPDVAITAGASYAGKTLTTSGVSSYSAGKGDFDEEQWAPEATCIHTIPNVSGPSWSTDCLVALAYMEEEMAVTADLTGTGVAQKPDVALMARAPFHALTAKAVTNQGTYGIPAQLVNKDLALAGWKNIIVGGLTCIKDNNVPNDSGSKERVVILDTSQFEIVTTHTKKEGLIKNDFDETAVLVNGVIGKLTANLYWRVNSPTAIGVIVGCDD